MDEQFDLYESEPQQSYAAAPTPNPTLALVYGVDGGNFKEVQEQTATMGAAYVAAERAKLVRKDNLSLLKGATLELAKQGNSAAVQEALNQIEQVQVPVEEPSFYEDVRDTSEDVLERMMITTGKSREEIINYARVHSDNTAIRTSFEVAISSLPKRSEVSQLAQGAVGFTTAEDWMRLSPVVNEELEKLGYTSSRATTFGASVSNFLETLRTIGPQDSGKIISVVSDRLTAVVGEKSTRRFLEAAQQGLTDSTAEAVFGSLDLLSIAALAKAGVRVALGASRSVSLARKVGAEDGVVADIASKLSNGESVLGVSTQEAQTAAITSRSLLSKELDGVSASVQQNLKDRLEASIKDLDNAMYTGGAKADEVMATKARLERLYTSENNPSIVTSKVEANVAKGKVNIDVLYGTSSGKPFATAEEALAYYKGWKRGDLEVVPVGGTTDEVAAAIGAADERVTAATTQLQEAKYVPRMSTAGDLSIVPKSPLYVYPPRGTATVSAGIAALSKDTRPITEVWNMVKETAKPRERLVVDKLIKTLPETTKVVIKEGSGRAYYFSAKNTIVMFDSAKDTNTFTHELIHAVTSNKLKYGKVNPSSPIGKVVTRMDTLRGEVIKSISKIKDPELVKDLKYLTSSLDEFSTAGLWSINQLPKVAVYLNNIKYKNTTLLSHIWESFKELLGFGNKDTALSEWFGLSEELTRQGLKVTLPEELQIFNKTVKVTDRNLVYPSYLPNKTVDNALSRFEDAVADRIALDPKFEPTPSGFYVRQKADMPVFVEDIGKISQDELDKMHLLLGKVNPRLSSVNSLYSPALAAMFKRTKYGKVYGDFIKESFDKLNAASIDKVNTALTKTEKLKRDMSVFELGENGVKTEAEQEAYYAFRTMRNMQWYYKNREAAEALVAKGYQQVFVGMDEAGAFTGPARKRTLNDFMSKKIFDVENNKFVTVTSDNIKELDARGLSVYEYAKAQTLEGRKGAITVIATPPNKLRVGDITDVVGRVDGAYSRVYTEEYWVKLRGQQLVNDTYEDTTYAFRTAVSEKDASAYVQGLNDLLAVRAAGKFVDEALVTKYMGSFEREAKKFADEINTGKFDGARAQFNYTRLDDNFFRDVTGIGSDDMSGGRVFWSGRSEDGIKSISTGGTDVEALGPLQSLEAEISNTARFTSINDWRRNSIQRWYNTFGDTISDIDKKGTRTPEDVFFNVVNNVKGYAVSDKETRRMLATKDFIISQLGVKTVDEKVIQHAVNNLTSNITVPGFSHVGQVIRRTDLIDWAKSVNSTLMLGMFSVSQLVVQSSGMLLAASISPKHGLKAAFAIRPILTALTSDNPSVWKHIFKHADVAKSTGMAVDEFGQVAAAIKRVGLLDNIGASSTYNGADGSLNIFARNKAKFHQSQMMFFNKGEEINRVGAFEIARREFIEANPKVDWTTDDVLQTIVQRADDLSMNMTSVNEARIAQGVMGIPLQFLQHNIRLGTNLIASVSMAAGKRSPTLTPKEAFQLTLGSYLLYGVSNNATPDFIEEWLGEKMNGTLTEQQKQYITQGVIAGLLSTVGEAVTGERTNIALGSRLSSIQWYEDLGDAMFDLLKGEKADLKRLAGPTGSTLVSLMELPEIFLDYRYKEEWTAADFSRTLSTFGATMVSSWRGIDKAYWAYHANGMLLTKRGDVNAHLTTPELIAQALGFQGTEAYESGTVFKTNKEYKATMQSYADTIMRLEGQARKSYLAGDMESMQNNYAAAEAVVAPLPEADRQAVKRLIRNSTSYDTVGREAFNKWATTMSTHKNRLLVTNPHGEVNGD